MFWFLFNIIMFIVFLVKRVERIALWIPGIAVFDVMFSYVGSFIIGFIGGFMGLSFESLKPLLVILGSVFPLILVCIIIVLMRRKK